MTDKDTRDGSGEAKIFNMFDSMEKSTLGIEEGDDFQSNPLQTMELGLITDRELVEHQSGDGKCATAQDILDDFTSTRQHLIKLAAQCQEATDTALKISAMAPNPEYLNVVSNLLGKSMQIGEKLLKMHERALTISKMFKELRTPEEGEEEAEEKQKVYRGTMEDVLNGRAENGSQ